jgi:uncharacterized protein (DUF736 family)
MRLGQFVQDKEGNFHGTLKSYGLPETSVILTPQTSQQGKPYYEITADPVKGAFDGGAAFPKQKGEMEYLSVTLDSPLFPAPVNAALFQDKTNHEIYNLVWDRPEPKPALTAENTATVSNGQANGQINSQQLPMQQKRSFFRKSPGATM